MPTTLHFTLKACLPPPIANLCERLRYTMLWKALLFMRTWIRKGWNGKTSEIQSKTNQHTVLAALFLQQSEPSSQLKIVMQQNNVSLLLMIFLFILLITPHTCIFSLNNESKRDLTHNYINASLNYHLNSLLQGGNVFSGSLYRCVFFHFHANKFNFSNYWMGMSISDVGRFFPNFHTANKYIIQSRWFCRTRYISHNDINNSSEKLIICVS